jgi:hypothetical protein
MGPNMRSGADWRWFGYAGHLRVPAKCVFHMSTHIPAAGVLVSTIGDYRPGDGKKGRDTIGSGAADYYETMVFECYGVAASGDPSIESLAELECVRYAESIDAERGHYDICWQYQKKAEN